MHKKLVILISVLAILCAAAVLVGVDIRKDFTHNRLSSPVTFTVDDGESANVTINKLHENGVIRYPAFFKLKCRRDSRSSAIKSGAVTINPGMSYDDIMSLLTENNRNTVKVTIPEGYELRMIAERIEQEGLATQEEFYAAANPADYSYPFLTDLPQRENPLEGYLYPDTYIFPETAAAHDIIDAMLSEFNSVFTEEYINRAEELDMTVDSIVTLASIIERETDNPDERAKVAGVFYNRINSGMYLQSCATVQYVLAERKARLTNDDIAVDSPYNTYKYPGLPIGPIASPGKECIEAALYPEQTTAKFFVLGADGKHIFSDTYEEHLIAKNSVG